MTNSAYLKIILSALVFSLSIIFSQYYFLLVALVPYFIEIINGEFNYKKNILFSFVVSFVLVVPVHNTFEQYSSLSGLFLVVPYLIVSSILFTNNFFVSTFFRFIQKRFKKNNLISVTYLIVLYSLLECVRTEIFCSIPILNYNLFIPFCKNEMLIQLTSHFGHSIIILFVVMVNVLLAFYIHLKKPIYLYTSVYSIVLYLLLNFIDYKLFEVFYVEKKVPVALINSNFGAQDKWNEANGNRLVASLFENYNYALSSKAEYIFFTETVVPWSYNNTDPFITELVEKSSNTMSNSIIGISTEIDKSKLYNSVYSLSSNGKINDLYHKSKSLPFIESKVKGTILPSLSTLGKEIIDFKNENRFKISTVNSTVSLCNELCISNKFYGNTESGLLITLGNDAWVNNSYFVNHHLYYAKLRAVEQRKEMLLNINQGYSAHINARGEVQESKISNEAFVLNCTINLLNETKQPINPNIIFIYLCSILIFTIHIINNKQTKTNNK
jgi:apolipoprotein N-acyltransferase